MRQEAGRWLERNIYRGSMAVILFGMVLGAVQLVGTGNKFGQSLAGDSSGSFREAMMMYPAIDILLRNYLSAFSAARVEVGRFDFAGRDIGGNRTYHLMHDVVLNAPGVATDFADLRVLPIGMYSVPLGEVSRGRAAFLRTDQIPGGPLRDLLDRRGVVEIACAPVTDLSDRIIGIVTMAWTKEAVLDDARRTLIKANLMAVGDRIGAYFDSGGQ